jgi:dihydrolipoamide dehydrogenase
MTQQIIIIGGGPGGIEAALTAARAGRPVTLISDGPVGGRAGWHSLLPSKAWLAAAEAAPHSGAPADIAALLERVTAVKRTWNNQSAAALAAAGVRVEQGQAVFLAPDQIALRDRDGEQQATYSGATVIAAPGSVPVFPPELRPDGRSVLAPRFLSKLDRLPATMLVIGAGATGCEAAYLFNALGVQVTWIIDQYGVLPGMHPDAGAFLAGALARQGVHQVAGQQVARLEREEGRVTAVLADDARYEAQMAFVATGRAPDVAGLNLAAAGLAAELNGRFPLTPFGQTSNPRLYLIGDADGGWMIANKAMNQGRIAALHAAGQPTAPYDPGLIIQPVYSEPGVAQVGHVGPSGALAEARIATGAALKAHLLPAAPGFLTLTYTPEDGLLRGALAAGPHAAETLAPVVVALKLGARLDDLAALYGAHPTLSELAFLAARAA